MSTGGSILVSVDTRTGNLVECSRSFSCSDGIYRGGDLGGYLGNFLLMAAVDL